MLRKLPTNKNKWKKIKNKKQRHYFVNNNNNNNKGKRRRGPQRMRWLDGITDPMDMNLGKLLEMVRDREAWPAVVHVIPKSWTKLGNRKATATQQHHWVVEPECLLGLVVKGNNQALGIP